MSIVYCIVMLFYRALIINLYGLEDIGLINGLIIIILFLIVLFCIMVKSETLLKYGDPLNINNKKRYVIMFINEGSAIVVAYLLATSLVLYTRYI